MKANKYIADIVNQKINGRPIGKVEVTKFGDDLDVFVTDTSNRKLKLRVTDIEAVEE